MLQNMQLGDLSETFQLVHLWGQEYWFHCHNNFLFYRPVYGGASLEQTLILSGSFGSKRLLLGGPHTREVITGVVRWYKLIFQLLQIVFCVNAGCMVSIPNSSNVRCHICHISVYKPMNINKRFSRQFTGDIG